MNMIYVALNGDNIGDAIGNAIASDDYKSLQNVSGAIKGAHSQLEQWIANKGGKVIVSSGDESMFQIPEEALNELEDIKQQYADSCGNSCSIGVGNSMSEASKALIYSKLNGKDQITEYEPAIEDYLSDEDEDDLPEGQDIEDSDEQDTMDEEGVEDNVDEDEEGEDFDGEGEITTPAKDMVDEHEELVDTLESPSHEDDLEEADKQKQELEEYKDSEETGKDKYISEDGENEPQDLDEDEVPEDSGNDEDFIDNGTDDDEDDRCNVDDPKKIIDDVKDSNEDDFSDAEMIDKDGDGDIDEIDEEDNTPDNIPELGDDEVMQDPNEDFGDEVDEGSDPNQISDMVHAHVNGEQYDDGGNYGQIKQDIANSLQTFKQNKQLLDQAKDQTPELYSAMIAMMRSMVEMGKLLNVDANGDDHMSDIEQSPEAADAIPEADQMQGGIPPKK